MPISSLQITDFRNLFSVSLSPCSHGLNVIYGNNGSGKTSLLEAIHYISLGKSFRSSTSGRLIRHEADKFIIFAQLINNLNHHVPVGIERGLNGAMRIRIEEKDVATITELAAFMPIRIIDTHSQDLFEAGPIFRRKFLDWGLFYQFDAFLPCWRSFERALKQRNSLLKDKKSKQEIDGWTKEVVKYGLELTELRRKYVELLQPFLAEAVETLLGTLDLQIQYYPGWDESEDYAALLSENHYEEYRLGYTQFGPHRADLNICIEALAVKHFLSRGQQKLLVCAMILAQGMLLEQRFNQRVIYLVDDLPAELDSQSKEKLLSLLAKQQTQVFITAIEREALCEVIASDLNVPMKVFHVEHGRVKEIE